MESQAIIVDAQNSAKKRQQRGLVPFKSKKELGGKLDPRINVGGRPKQLTGAYKAMLAEIDEETGKTKAEMIAESLARAAQQEMLPHSVSAAKELRQATEGGDDGNKIIFHFDGDMARVIADLAKPIEGEFEKIE